MARGVALTAALAVSLLAVAGAGGAPAQSPKRGGTVVVGGAVVREPGCLNAYLLRCGSGTPQGFMGLALRGAFRIDVAPHYAYRPDLVSGVEYTTTPPYTLTYHVRPEAHWSDGVPVTARDFEFTYAALRSVEQELWEPDAEYYAKIRSVTAVDAKTVRVVLRSRLAGWRGLFPRILPSHALRGEDFSTVWLDGISNPKTGKAIGSGPFLVEHWEHGRSVTLVRNPRYWRNHPAFLDRLVLRFCQQCGAIGAEQVEWLRSGEVDVVMSPVLTDEQVQALRSVRGVRVLPNQGANWEHLDVRMDTGGHPALESKLVRQALAYGIDRVALARALNGQFEARYPPSDSAMFFTNSAHYRPNWQRYRYRPAEARRLLERAGCRREPDGIYACDGQTVVDPPRDPRRKPAPSAVARAHSAPASASRDRDRARVRPAERPLQRDPAGRQLRPRCLLVPSIPGEPPAERWGSTGAGAYRTSPATASGFSRVTSTRHSESSIRLGRRLC